MILTDEQKQILLNENSTYDCFLHTKRFGHYFFNDSIKSLGNVIGFESPVEIGPIRFDNAFTIVCEIPSINLFTGVCLLRLYCAQLGSIITGLSNLETALDESTIFIENMQATVSLINTIKESIIFHIIFPLETKHENFYSLNLKEDRIPSFKLQAIDSFEHLTRSIFKETQRDNI
jgi:hypothetical protein